MATTTSAPATSLLGLVHDDHNTASETLTSLGISVAEVQQQIDQAMDRSAESSLEHLLFTSPAKAVLDRSVTAADQRGHADVDTEHLLLALTVADGTAGQLLHRSGLEPTRLRQVLSHNAGLPERPQPDAFAGPGGNLDGCGRRAERDAANGPT